ncbi:Ig-like domain-containing protein [Flavobacterium procerum]|uniref:Ig-like domain-containing protein n=1 Tax=Flavobacterium procerum TaxID=1455569 RepID=A0ABV6BMP5_9FLAO
MKKTLLLFLLLPILGFAQEISKWNASTASHFTPVVNTNLTPLDITTNGGVNIGYISYNSEATFFQTGNWPVPQQNGTAYDANKYVQFSIQPKAGYKADVTTFTFQCRSGSGKFKVRYSKDATFTTGVFDLITETDNPSDWTTFTRTLSNDLNPVLDNEKVYIRIYSYSTNNTFEIKTGTLNTNIVPVMNGTVTTFDATKIMAIKDFVDTKTNTAINIYPLKNDVKKENVTSLVVSTPPAATEGTVIVNPDRTLTFNPAKDFVGTSTFSYSISNGTETSTATIKVTVSNSIDSNLSIWDGAGNSLSPKTNIYVNDNAPVTATGVNLNYTFYNTDNAFFQTSGWPNPQENGGKESPTKYVEFKISPDSKHKLNIKQFNFTYRGQNQKFLVKYSKSTDFSTGAQVLIPETNTASDWTTLTNNISASVSPVLPGETLYIRFYVYSSNNTFEIKNGNGNLQGPTITGTVEDVFTLTANDDYVSTPTNQAATISILQNDVVGGYPIQSISLTQPVNGTVALNASNQVVFTPSSSFTGSTSFTYTIRNSNSPSDYSSATVFVNGTPPPCTPAGDQTTFGANSWTGYVYKWTGTYPNPATPNTLPISATSTYIGTVTENALFDRNVGTGAVNGVTRNINCETPPTDNFFVRYKMRTTTAAGIYNFTIGADDGVRLYIDGVLVNVAPTNSYTGHGYNSYAAQVTLDARAHDFVLEYFEMGGSARVSFSYGIISTVLGASNPPGTDKWNVYGYTLANLDIPAYSYAGSYVDNNLNIATTAFWNRAASPSSTTGWSGAPVPVDNFTISYKRKGFPCGRYRIVVANCDDNLRIYRNGTLIYTAGGNINNNTAAVNNTTYDLGADSEIEVRLQEDAGDALMNVNFIPSTTPGDAANAPTASATKQPSCADNTGTITVTNPASSTGFTYSIDGTSYTNTTGVFTGLTAGSYNVTVKNTSTGCISPATVIAINPAAGKVWNGSTNTSWNTPSNWTPSGVPTTTDCVEIPNVAVKPILAASTGTYYAYSLTINNQASLTVGSNNTIQVTNAVTVLGNGQLIFENNSSLIQTTNATNSGYITYKRSTQLVKRFDFTYWSTPVIGADNTLHNLSPNTLFDKYYSYDAAGDKWAINNYGTINMAYGIGYIVRAPQSYSTTVPAVYTGSFVGTPNNGPYTIHPISGKWNLIGNPYPSALDAEELIDVNHLAGTDIGALYFWTHNSPPSSANSGNATKNYTSNDYAVYSLAGSIVTTSGAASPSGYIAAGQGFFVQPSGSSILFNNSMRVSGNNTQFFKTSASAKTEKNRVWLNFTNTQGAFKQALIGYVENATNKMDTNYDALTMGSNSYVDFYSINDKDLLTIQARALPFDKADIVPLGYKTTVAGNFTIGIDHTDGLFAEQAVYLEDKTTGVIHDLRTADYTFATAVGTFADRFVLRYTSKTLGTGDFENVEDSVLIAVKDKTVNITSTKENIKDVLIYNIGGQELYSKKKVTATELQITNLQAGEQVLLVKVTLENDHVVTKKIIFR